MFKCELLCSFHQVFNIITMTCIFRLREKTSELTQIKKFRMNSTEEGEEERIVYLKA